MSRGRFPLSGGNGRRPKGVGMMSRSDRGDRDRCPRRGRMRPPKKAFPLGGRWHGEAVTDEGAMIERFFVGPDALIGPLDGSFRRGDFAACGRRVSFWMPRKKPKRHQGAAQVVRRGALYPETFPHFRRGGTLGRPPGGQAKKSPSSVTLRVPPSPLQGEGFRAGLGPAPTADMGATALFS